ncbi:MAG TPA: HAMP domain-containing protein [Micromonosporaceae bacterium]|jgi:HAMP domain-containing protein
MSRTARTQHNHRKPIGSYDDELTKWRRIALDKQLPRPRFPAGLAVPSTVALWCLLIVSVGCMTYSALPAKRAVPQAVIESQRALVSTLAHRLTVAASRDADELAALAARYDRDRAHGAALVTTRKGVTWRGGLAIIDGPKRTPIAHSGEPIDVRTLPVESGRPAAIAVPYADGAARLVFSVPLADGRVLVGSAMLGLRALQLDPESRQSMMYAVGGKTLIHSQGRSLAAGDAALRLIPKAVQGAARHSHNVVGKVIRVDGSWRAPMATAAPVGSLGAHVVSVVYVARVGGFVSWTGVAYGGCLFLLALIGFVLIRLALVLPTQTVLGYAKAAACGEAVTIGRAPPTSEARRLARAVKRIGNGRARPAKTARTRGTSSSTIVAIACLTMLAWAAGAFVVLGSGAQGLPSQVMADEQNLTEDVANAVRDTLDQGLVELGSLAAAHATKDPAAMEPVLADFAEDDQRFRSLYLVDRRGHVTSRVGHDPERSGGMLPARPAILLDRHNSRIPLVLAATRFSAEYFLVGEYDVKHLVSVLKRKSGRLRVIDDHQRTILDTEGYRVYQPVSKTLATAGAAALGPGYEARISRVGGAHRLVSSAAVAGDQAATALHWAVVSERGVADFALPRNDTRQVAWLLALLTATVAVAVWSWHLVVLIRPLRRVANAAERLVAGDVSEAIPPSRLDEIGAIAMCLDICRQARVHGPDRLAGALRLRGAGNDFTQVMEKIPHDRSGEGGLHAAREQLR